MNSKKKDEKQVEEKKQDPVPDDPHDSSEDFLKWITSIGDKEVKIKKWRKYEK